MSVQESEIPRRGTPDWWRLPDNIYHRLNMYLVEYVKSCEHDNFGGCPASGIYDGKPQCRSPTEKPAFWYYDIETDQPVWIALKPSHGFYKTIFEDYAHANPERLNAAAKA